MQRYFIEKNSIINNEVTISSPDSHHIKDVMRFNLDDELLLNTDDGQVFLAQIKAFNKKDVVLQVIKEFPSNYQPLNLTVALSLIKKDNFELAIQKMTELGVQQIIPLKTKRSIIKIDDPHKKLIRFRTIVKEASEQSERTTMPIISDFVSLQDLDTKLFNHCFFAYERESKNLFSECLKQIKATDKTLVIVGPEGGFTEEEISYLINNGFKSISLGKTILRAETAAIHLVSVYRYLYGE